MMRATTLPLLAMVLLSGCGLRQWEVTFENKSNEPSSCYVTHGIPGGDGTANVEGVAKGKSILMVMGDPATVIKTVRVVSGKNEETLTPNANLPVGKRFAIVVDAEGKVQTSVKDR